MTQVISTNTYGGPSILVSPNPQTGNYTNINTAIAASTANTPVVVAPGTYSDDITLLDLINVIGYAQSFDNIIINNPMVTNDVTTRVVIRGISFVSNTSSPCITIGGTVAKVINFYNCSFEALNGPIISLTTSGIVPSEINFYNCQFDILGVSSSIYLYNVTGNNILNFYDCQILNDGGSTTPSNNSGGLVAFYNTSIEPLLTTSGSGQIYALNSNFSTGDNVACALTSSSFSTFVDCNFQTGTAACVTVGASSTAIINNCGVISSNSNPFSGLGTIEYNLITNNAGSTPIAPTSSTVTALGVAAGNFSSHSFTVSPSPSDGKILIGNGTNFSVNTLTPANGINVANGAGTITLSNLRDVSPYVVSSTSGQAGYTSVQSAINAAVSAGASLSSPAVVWIYPGSYTENITAASGVHLVGVGGGNAVQITGNLSFSGSGSFNMQNLYLYATNDTPVVSISSPSSGTFYIYDCIIEGNTGGALSVTGVSLGLPIVNMYGGTIQVDAYGPPITINGGNIYAFNVTVNGGSGSGSSFTSATASRFLSCYVVDAFALNSSVKITFEGSTMQGSSTNVPFTVGGSSTLSINNSLVFSSSSNYWVTGSGVLLLGGVAQLLGMSGSLIDPSLFVSNTNYTVNMLATLPPASSSASLALGVAYQNTEEYDVMVVVYIEVDTGSITISSGVGPTNTPTQQVIVNNRTLAGVNVIPVTVYIPSQYYALVSTSGTASNGIAGQQTMAI